MSLTKRHAAVWRALAIHLKVNNRTMASFEKRRAHGDEFFYHRLPSLGKDLERGLQGKFELTSPFFKKQRNSALPTFLYELFIKIFDKEGYILEQPIGIRDTRQLLMMFYKFEVPFSAEQLEKANQEFIERDQLVKVGSWPDGLADVRKNFLSLLPSDPLDIRPHHSNGASATSVTNSGKRYVRRVIPSLMRFYDAQYFFNTSSHAKNWCKVNKTVTTESCSRITQVPKDSRGPRTICMEPHELMFIQKGLQVKLYDHIEKYSPAKGYINFIDQTINQKLAQKYSKDRSLVTIDLKDASDMVSWDLIKYLVPPDWFKALSASRSQETLVNGSKHTLLKYAPMGSALCFPIEAMLFWSICRTLTRDVWVYGDDIIVPLDSANDCITALESYGLRINYDKTLSHGFFRESCGGDYYKGQDVTYVKCKSYDALSYIAFCNLITERYGLDVSHSVLSVWEDDFGPVMRQPLSESASPRPCVFYTDRLASSYVFFKRRWNKDLQKYEQRWLQPRALPDKKVSSKKICHSYNCTDDDLLFDWFTSVNHDPDPIASSFWKQIEQELCPSLQDRDYKVSVDYSHVADNLPVDRRLVQQPVFAALKYTWGDTLCIIE